MTTRNTSKEFDVLVVGGGNAALCAAITAREKGASVLMLETAPKAYRGGNSRHTRNFRCMHSGPQGVLTGSYDEQEYFDDLLKVTKGRTDEHLARMTIHASQECYGWMEAHGVHFQPALSGTLSLSRTNAFFLGGGKSLVNAYYRTASNLGVEVVYDARMSGISSTTTRGSPMPMSKSTATCGSSGSAPSSWLRAASKLISIGWQRLGGRQRGTS